MYPVPFSLGVVQTEVTCKETHLSGGSTTDIAPPRSDSGSD